LQAQGDLDEALTYYRKALAIRQALADADPKDARVRAGLARTYSNIGNIFWAKKQFRDAIAAHQAALAIRSALFHGDPTNDGKRFEVAQSQAQIAEAYAETAFRPQTSSAKKLALCQQVESLLKEALPVYQERKDRLVGSEVDQLAESARAAARCSVGNPAIAKRAN
jgi:tetratricopeptide (TPR) repeat protein